MTQTIIDPITGEVRKNAGGAALVSVSRTGSIERHIILFDNAPASVAISSGVVTIASANLVTITPTLANATRYSIYVMRVGTTSQEYVVGTVNASDVNDAINRMSHSMSPSDTVVGVIVPPGEGNSWETSEAITRLDLACVGTTPAADNGFIVVVTFQEVE